MSEIISVEKDWRLLLQAAVIEAAFNGVEALEIQQQFENELELYYVGNGDPENPDPDNVYDMLKDKELGI